MSRILDKVMIDKLPNLDQNNIAQWTRIMLMTYYYSSTGNEMTAINFINMECYYYDVNTSESVDEM